MTNDNLHPASEALEAYAESANGRGDRAAVETHLVSCARCQAEVEEWRSLFATLEALPRFAPSAGFAARVMAHVRVRSARAAWHAQALAQVAAAGRSVGRWLPQTTRGWAFVTAMLALPAIVGTALVAWLLSRSYITTEALWVAAVGAVDRGATRLGTAAVDGAMQTDVAAWLTANVGAFLQTAGMRGIGALAALAGVLTVLSIWILYRNLFRTPRRESSYVTYSF